MSENTKEYAEGFHDGALAVLVDLVTGHHDKLLDRMEKWVDKLEKSQPKEASHV